MILMDRPFQGTADAVRRFPESACGHGWCQREYISRLESGKVALTEEIKAKLTDALDKLNPENPLEMVLDYVRIRFPSQDVKHVVEDILKIRLDVMIHEDFGFYSYSEHYVLGDVFVLTSPDEEKGTLLEPKGKGCRQMESYLLA